MIYLVKDEIGYPELEPRVFAWGLFEGSLPEAYQYIDKLILQEITRNSKREDVREMIIKRYLDFLERYEKEEAIGNISQSAMKSAIISLSSGRWVIPLDTDKKLSELRKLYTSPWDCRAEEVEHLPFI